MRCCASASASLPRATATATAAGAQLSVDYMQDADLAGPLVFCLGLGLVLLLKGKASFGAIYGCGAIGCGGMYIVLNLMYAPCPAPCPDASYRQLCPLAVSRLLRMPPRAHS